MILTNRSFVLGLVCLGAFACDEGGSPPHIVTVDSLATGRVLVENIGDGLWKASLERPLEPVVRIGSVEGTGPDAFGRVIDVALGPDETVYVLDIQAAAIQVFGLDGEFIRTIGGPGQGPGELGAPYALAFDSEDHLWVADAGNRRYVRFDMAGELVSDHPSPIRGGIAQGSVRWLPPGSLLDLAFIPGEGLSAVVLEVGQQSVIRDTLDVTSEPSVGFARVTASGEELTVIPPHSPTWQQGFGPDGELWLGHGGSYRIHEVTFAGDTVRTVSRATPPTMLSPADREAQSLWAAERRSEGFDGDDSALPAAYPYFERIAVADDGHLWVFRRTDEGWTFDVFDGSGQFLGASPTELDAGSGGVAPEVSRGYLAGVETDSLGVQFVRVFRILSPG